MRVIYLEDDLIDQLAFKRYADQGGIEYSIASTIQEAKIQLQSSNFDAAFLDFNLVDGTAIDLLPNLMYIPVVVFCDPSKIPQELVSQQLFFERKPITSELLNRFIPLALDLSYFDELTESDHNFKIEIVTLTITSIIESMAKVKKSFASGDLEQLKFELHKMKSPFRVFKLPCLEELNFVESNILVLSKDVLNDKVNHIDECANTSLLSLNLFLKKLKNIESI
jgi:hypothetical protein